jgi:hypothetical protein
MRKAKDSDFFIDLPDVGLFRYGRQTFQDRATIRANFLRIVKELDNVGDDELIAYAGIMALHPTLCVECPPGWESIDSIEITEETDAQIFDLFARLQKEDANFRKGSAQDSEVGGEAVGGDVRVLDSEKI